MDLRTAVALLTPLVRPGDSRWADIGAGTGVFTRALAALLPAPAVIHALDRDPAAVRTLERVADSLDREEAAPSVVVKQADLMNLPPLPSLDGVLAANVLHFVPRAGQPVAVAQLSSLLEPGGRLVVIEYDGRPASRWVPFPLSRRRLSGIARSEGLSEPVVTATRHSAYGGLLYVAVIERR